MKKFFMCVCMMVVMVAIPLSAFGAPANTVERTGEGKTVGIASLHLVNDWNNFATDELKNYLEARGYKVTHTNAMDSTSQMVKDVENLIEKKVDGIVIAGGEGHAFMDLSITAKNAGIKVIGMDMYLPGASSGVAADNYTGGTMIGQFMVNKMRGEGKYIVLNSPGWQSLTIRRRMALAVFEDFPGMKLVGEYEVATDPLQTSIDAVKAAVQNNPDLKGVLCTWGLPGIGAAQAVQDLGLQKQIVVVCADSDREVMEKMSESDAPMMANIGQDPRINGAYAAEMLDKAINEGDENMPTMYFAPTLMVSNDDYIRDFPEIVRINMADLWDRVYVEYPRTF
ncbi:MAG: sugar ABC transporter substrate-binding protein [Tannerellaceae bacterium]|jgi:ABC-type sugar transport system substrate-binding protein|nr:sugar ABC transporter substrate-binding protein [Tannerellaceae bacterium]